MNTNKLASKISFYSIISVFVILNMADASAQSPQATTDKNAQRMEILYKEAEKIYKTSKIKVPKRFVRYHESYKRKRGKFKKYAARFDNLKARGNKLRSQAINFKNADAYTRVSMRCSSDLKGLKAAAKRAKIKINNYLKKREKACQLAVFVAKLKKMYSDWQVMKQEGFPLVQQYKKQQLKFKKRKRTTQLWVDLRYLPTNKKLEYGVWFKWSDEKKIQLIPSPNSRTRKEERCIPLSGRANFCFKVLDANSSSVKVNMWASVRFNKRTKSIGFGPQTIPAPFGYIAQLEQMKAKKKQKAVEKMQKKLAEIAGLNQSTITLIQRVAAAK